MPSTQTAPFPGTLLLAMQIDPHEIGRRIKAARVRKGWTQMDLAVEGKVSVSSVQRWEGGGMPPLRELFRIAELLEVDPAEFVEEDDSKDDLHTLRQRLASEIDRLERLNDLLEERLAG